MLPKVLPADKGAPTALPAPPFPTLPSCPSPRGPSTPSLRRGQWTWEEPRQEVGGLGILGPHVHRGLPGLGRRQGQSTDGAGHWARRVSGALEAEVFPERVVGWGSQGPLRARP